MRTLAALLLLALAALPWPAAAETLERLPAVVHVHTDLSSGDFALEQIIELAEREGIGALLLSENYLSRVEYGLPPFRALTRVTHEEPSVAGAVARYLERVRRARATFPRTIIVPGVEVMPSYRWSGMPLAFELALADTQKNLLVWGLEDPDALERLPVVGNRRAGVYGAQSAIDALPVLLAIPGVILLVRSRRRRRSLGRAVVVVRRRAWLPGLGLCAVAAATLVRGWPFTVDRYPPYQDFGSEPYQRLIDHVESAGGVAMWSFPEARDEGERRVGPVHVTWRTEPYADSLLRTFRYTAFGVLYEDTTTVERPDGEWDRLLREYAAGERSRPAWGLAESGFHGFTANKAIGPVRTVFLVDERSPAGVLAAMRRGRMYAVLRTPQWGLELGELSVATGEHVATMGQTIPAASGAPLELRATIAASDGAAHPVRVTLIRNGTIADVWAASTPVSLVHQETVETTPAVFRLDVRAGAQRLLTNPVIVRPSPRRQDVPSEARPEPR